MSAHGFNVREPLVDTRVRVYAEKLGTLAPQSRSRPVCQRRSIMFDGTPLQQCLAALRSRSSQRPFVVSKAITVLVRQRTLSLPKALTTWLVDIAVAGGTAHARVYSTLPRLDVGPIPVSPTDDVVAVAIKVLEAADA